MASQLLDFKFLMDLGMLIPHLQEDIKKWEEENKTLNVLITGKSGTGKSTLINAIMGKDVATEGHQLDPMTTDVKPYTLQQNDITANVYDSPGLEDGTENQAKYLADIKAKYSDMDLVIYCIRMSEDRVLAKGPDVKAMKILTETFGHEMWQNMIFVLTFANDIVAAANEELESEADIQQYFGHEFNEWETMLRAILHETVGVPKETVAGIDIIPVGHKHEPVLPDLSSASGESYWLSRVWLKALGATKQRAQLALIKFNLDRIQTREKEFKNDGDVKAELREQLTQLFAEKGGEFGQVFAKLVPTGEVVGSMIGRIIAENPLANSLALWLAVKNGMIDPSENFDIPPDKRRIC